MTLAFLKSEFFIMKREIKAFLRSMKKRRQLKAVLGTDISSLQRTIEQALMNALNVQVDINSCYHDLGGLNNLGMFIHKLEHQDKPFAISKLQNSVAAGREYRFQRWQENYAANQLSAKAFFLGVLKDEDYSWVSGEILYKAENLSDIEVKALFDKLSVSAENLKDLSLDGSVRSLVYELEDNTKIKSVLLNLISQLGTENAAKFTKRFFNERKSLLSCSNGLYEKLDNLFTKYFSHVLKEDISFMYGLVHGDFKKQNIMLDEEGNCKVIDLQYYTYGIRIWDLAFYYSKESRDFSEIYSNLLKNFSWRIIELETFIIFYLIATTLHIKNKNAQKIISLKVSPAVDCLSNLLIR